MGPAMVVESHLRGKKEVSHCIWSGLDFDVQNPAS